MVRTKAEKEIDRQQAIDSLRRFIKPGARVYTALRFVSSTGMSRRIRTYVVTQKEGREPDIWDCTYFVSEACGFRFNRDKGDLVIGGAGMDMGYHVVYTLGQVLFRDGFKCIGQGCPSNDHSNDYDGSWDRDTSLGRLHSGGGFALNQSWL